MEKTSAHKLAQVVREAQTTLISVTNERDKLAEENYQLRTHMECTKLAQVMHSKGIDLDVELPTLVVHLEKQAAAGKLAEITRAVDIIGPNMSFGSALANSDLPGSGGGGDAFTNFILGQVG